MMTKQEYIDYYKDLLILQYRGKQNAEAHISLLADIFSMDLLPLELLNSFDLDSAEGVQLDILAKYFGVNRTGRILNGQIVTLDDNDLRELMRLIQITNYTNATLYEMKNLLYQNFGNNIILVDYLDMRIGYVIYPSIGSSELGQFIVANNLLPSPMGVLTSATIIGYDNAKFYGFVTYGNQDTTNIAPFTRYDDGFKNTDIWLRYSDSVEVEDNIGIVSEDGNSNVVTEQNNNIIYEQD